MERRCHEGLPSVHRKLRRDAAEAALIRDLARDPVNRDMYSPLYDHFSRLADEVEQALSTSSRAEPLRLHLP
jgi:hypothetical protein